MYMGPEAGNLSTWTTPISISPKAKVDREDEVRQANEVVMPCIEPYTTSRVQSGRIPHAKKQVCVIKTAHMSTDADINARVESTTPPFFSVFFFAVQRSGPQLFFLGNIFFSSVLRSRHWLFFFLGGWWASTKTSEELQTQRQIAKWRVLPEGRTKFCTLIQKTGSLSCHILQVDIRTSEQRKDFPLKGGDLDALKLMRACWQMQPRHFQTMPKFYQHWRRRQDSHHLWRFHRRK